MNNGFQGFLEGFGDEIRVQVIGVDDDFMCEQALGQQVLWATRMLGEGRWLEVMDALITEDIEWWPVDLILTYYKSDLSKPAPLDLWY